MAKRLRLVDAPHLQRFLLNVRSTGRSVARRTDADAEVEELEIREDRLICVGKRIRVCQNPEVDTSEKVVGECSLLFSLRHPNIIQYLGLCFLQCSDRPTVGMEYMPHSLDQLLRISLDIPLPVKHSILGEVARGLVYLHSRSPPVVHGKLTASNILLTSAMVAKISNVGVSQHSQLSPQPQVRSWY